MCLYNKKIHFNISQPAIEYGLIILYTLSKGLNSEVNESRSQLLCMLCKIFIYLFIYLFIFHYNKPWQVNQDEIWQTLTSIILITVIIKIKLLVLGTSDSKQNNQKEMKRLPLINVSCCSRSLVFIIAVIDFCFYFPLSHR